MIAEQLERNSLIKNQPQTTSIKVAVSILGNDDRIHSVSLVLDNNTVEETIRLAVVKLNNSHRLGLDQDIDQYELYGARKSGKKKADLPSLMKCQVISKTGMNRFALCPLYHPMKQHSVGKLYSLKSIETDFAQKRSRQEFDKVNTVRNNGMGCFCFC